MLCVVTGYERVCCVVLCNYPGTSRHAIGVDHERESVPY